MTCVEVECLGRQGPEFRSHLRMSRREFFLPGNSPQASTLAAQSTVCHPRAMHRWWIAKGAWALSAEGNLELLAVDRSAEAETESVGPDHMAVMVNSGP